MRPAATDHPTYYAGYIAKTSEEHVLEAIVNSAATILSIFKTIPEEKGDFAYADGKWSIKQLILHICDAERIFAYRALRFSRGDAQQPLPFEEDDYAKNCEADKRTLSSCIAEFEAVRNASIHLFKNMSPEVLTRFGQMAGGRTTVNSLGFMISGHALHHASVLKEQYLKK